MLDVVPIQQCPIIKEQTMKINLSFLYPPQVLTGTVISLAKLNAYISYLYKLFPQIFGMPCIDIRSVNY